jgi:hypothetical protein
MSVSQLFPTDESKPRKPVPLSLGTPVLAVALSLFLGALGVAGAMDQQESAPTAPAETQGRVWLGPDGKPLPFTRDEEILEFLRTAEIVSMKDVPEGITHPRKVLLKKDGIQMHAVFRDVNEEKAMVRLKSGKTEVGFRDSFVFESAAYELSRLLGLDNVPPVVPRRVRAKSGSLQVWIENAMTETVRREKGLKPPNPQEWTRQVSTQRIFDALINNTDRNLGNTLIDSNWKMWMIDHTRAFRIQPELRNEPLLQSCERALWEKLRALDAAAVKERLKEYLREQEINAVLERRQMLVGHFQKLIDERGEQNVLVAQEQGKAR